MYINSSKDINKAALGLIRAAADRALKTDDANAQLDAVSYASGVQDLARVLTRLIEEPAEGGDVR